MPLDVEEECHKEGAGRPPLAESEPREPEPLLSDPHRPRWSPLVTAAT